MDRRAIYGRDWLSRDVLFVDRHWLGGLGARSWVFSLLPILVFVLILILILILIVILVLVLVFILIPIPVLILIFIIVLILVLFLIFILISISVFIVRVHAELCKLTRRVLIESARVIIGKDHRNGCGRYRQVGHRHGMICHQGAKWAMIARGALRLGDGVGWGWLGGKRKVWGRKGQVWHRCGTICHRRAERPNVTRATLRLGVDIGRGRLGCGQRTRRRSIDML
jgi:hypothetical protein